LIPLDIKTASKFAQLEYKHGDFERGRTIFEGIVDSHSKRWDIWSVYIDMEAGQKNIQAIRYFLDGFQNSCDAYHLFQEPLGSYIDFQNDQPQS